MRNFTLILTFVAAAFLLIACERSVGYDPISDAGVDAGSNQNNNNQPDAEVQHGYLVYEVDHFVYPAPHRDAQIPITFLDFYANGEDARILRLTFELKGSIDPSEIINVSLYRELPFELVATNYVWDGRFVSFDLSADPLGIPDGDQQMFTLRVELDADPCEDTIGFDISDSHIEVIGSIYGPGYNVVEGVLSSPPNPVGVVGKQMAFALAPANPPPADVFVGTDDHVFIAYNVSTTLDVRGVATVVYVNLPDADSANYFSDLKFWMRNSIGEWEVIMGPLELSPVMCYQDGFCSIAMMSDTYDLTACETYEFRVTMDVSSGTSPLGIAASIDIPGDHFHFVDVWDDPNEVPPENISGGTLQGSPQTVIF